LSFAKLHKRDAAEGGGHNSFAARYKSGRMRPLLETAKRSHGIHLKRAKAKHASHLKGGKIDPMGLIWSLSSRAIANEARQLVKRAPMRG